MADISYNLEVQRKPNSKGLFPVYVRVTRERKHKRVKTNIALSRFSDWDGKKQKVKSSEPNYKAWNNALEDEIQKYKALERENEDASAIALVAIRKEGTKPKSFILYADEYLNSLLVEGKMSAYKHTKVTLNKFKDYLSQSRGKNCDLGFNELSVAIIRGFENYLYKLGNTRAKEESKSIHQNTIATHMKKLRAIMNQAIKENRMSADSYPFKAYSIKEVTTKKDYLEISDILELQKLALPDGLLNDVRNAFMFSFFCGGIRIADLLQLKWNDVRDNQINYQMGKNHKITPIVLVNQAKTILDLYYRNDVKESDYIFPFLDNNAKWAKYMNPSERDTMPRDLKIELFKQIGSKEALINKYLKKLAQMTGITAKLSFHIARHSYANYAVQNGIPVTIVQNTLNHTKLSTTQRYLGEFKNNAVSNAMVNLFGSMETQAKQEKAIEAVRGLSAEELNKLLEAIKNNG